MLYLDISVKDGADESVLNRIRLGIINRHKSAGVIISDTDGLYIGNKVVIEAGAAVSGGNRITGLSIIGADAVILPGNVIENSTIGGLCRVERSIIRDSVIESNTTVIMAHIHTHSKLGRDCRVGNFVEIKNSHIGKGNKIAHLAYVGDTDMGDFCNVGCGAIFVNYDGINKHRSIVGDSVFIGSNCNVIAPIKLENKAFIAAGTTVTQDLPPECMCIGRNRETIKLKRSNFGKVEKKLFGTDGIRGIYGIGLTNKIAYMCGNFVGYSSDGGKVAVGMDTRSSGASLFKELAAGITDSGAEVIDLGVVTTPMVASAVLDGECNYGVMLTASHNPSEYNGIKIFNNKAAKLSELEETEIERHIFKGNAIVRNKRGEITSGKSLTDKYCSDLIADTGNLNGINVILDCANGSAGKVAPELYESCGARVIALNTEKDGRKINDKCGATSVDSLISEVKRRNGFIGIAFDGDADRIIAVDEDGNIVNGDRILYILAGYLREKNKLNGNKIACTVLSNLGMKSSLRQKEIDTVITDVGDHNVVAAMDENNISLGGEQSGHVIVSDHLNTGDGVYVGALLMRIMKENGKKLSESGLYAVYPQLTCNIETDNKQIIDNPAVTEQVNSVNEYYKDRARLLIRASGTEPLIRIMAEADTESLALQLLELASRNIEKIIKDSK